MREREMRKRVESFIQSRLRNMLMPATLGLGLAVGACSDSIDATQMTQLDAGRDTSGATPVYSAPAPDANGTLAQGDARDLAPVSPVYIAQIPDSGQIQSKQDAGSVDAQVVEAGNSVDSQADDAGKADTYTPAVKYLAQLPDAGMVVRYMGPQPLYAAVMPGVRS